MNANAKDTLTRIGSFLVSLLLIAVMTCVFTAIVNNKHVLDWTNEHLAASGEGPFQAMVTMSSFPLIEQTFGPDVSEQAFGGPLDKLMPNAPGGMADSFTDAGNRLTAWIIDGEELQLLPAKSEKDLKAEAPETEAAEPEATEPEKTEETKPTADKSDKKSDKKKDSSKKKNADKKKSDKKKDSSKEKSE